MRRESVCERNELALTHQRLVWYAIHRLRGMDCGCSVEELASLAWERLLFICEHFDESRGVKFSTYALPALTRWLWEHRRRCLNARRQSRQGRCRALYPNEQLPGRALRPDELVCQHEVALAVEGALGLLTERRALALRLRYLDGLALSAVGERLGVGKEGARQIVLAALETLRQRAPQLQRLL